MSDLIRVEVTEADYGRLSARAQELLRVYSTPVVPARRGWLVFTIAAGRWEEIAALPPPPPREASA